MPPIEDDSSLATLLVELRHRAALSQSELANRSGLSVRTIRELEHGRVRTPRRDSMRLLADALTLDGEERAKFLRF